MNEEKSPSIQLFIMQRSGFAYREQTRHLKCLFGLVSKTSFVTVIHLHSFLTIDTRHYSKVSSEPRKLRSARVRKLFKKETP